MMTATEAEIAIASEVAGLRAGPVLGAREFSVLRRRLMLEGCKWDAQVGDESTLAAFPLILKGSVWNQLAAQAEQLATEAAAAEMEIARQPHLLRQLSLPSGVPELLGDADRLTPAAGRVIRFDFHPTTEGWRISEANSDVPGGFCEASWFPQLMADYHSGLQPAGNPTAAWCAALLSTVGSASTIALLSAPGYMEDHQVIAHLAQTLRQYGCHTHLTRPDQLQWREGRAHLDTLWYRGPLDAIVRFYQAEWLAKLPRECGWSHFFRDGKTPVANPPLSVISESKRFPLVWNQLSQPLHGWRAWLPETHEAREITAGRHGDWLLKTAFCNTGDTVSMPQLMSPIQWWQAKWRARFSAENWIAQRRFQSLPLATPLGLRHVCVGIYTVNGRAVGAYTRLSPRPVIDFAATDVALLLDPHA